MRKFFGYLSIVPLLLLTVFTQVGVVSCTKETIVRDTIEIIVKDTVIVRDTMFSELELIRLGLNDGLWAHYPIIGSAFDSSGNNHAMQLNGNAKFATDRWGNADGSISFEELNSYAIIPDGKLFNAQKLTVSFFVYVKNANGLFFGKQNYSNALGATFNVGFDDVIDGNQMRFAVTQNQSSICTAEADGSTKILQDGDAYLNEWRHVTIVNDESKMSLYINGKLVEEKNHGHALLTFCDSAEFVLGSWWQNDPKYFNGKIDNIRIYTRTLSAKEIAYLAKCD